MILNSWQEEQIDINYQKYLSLLVMNMSMSLDLQDITNNVYDMWTKEY